MEAFGQLAGGVAHDFNNFLTTILGYSDLLLDELGMKGAIADHISEIRNAAGRASVLTAQLLAFSRKHPLEPCVVDVNSLAGQSRTLAAASAWAKTFPCNAISNAAKKACTPKSIPGQLTQIILNLVVNARDAMPRGGCLALETCAVAVESPENHELGCEELPPGEYVRISVADNGMGMSDEVKEHLFEPFFTTKDEGRGSGLGLATSLRHCAAERRPHLCGKRARQRHDRENLFAESLRAPRAWLQTPRRKQAPHRRRNHSRARGRHQRPAHLRARLARARL